jgi:hypothetical protein
VRSRLVACVAAVAGGISACRMSADRMPTGRASAGAAENATPKVAWAASMSSGAGSHRKRLRAAMI